MNQSTMKLISQTVARWQSREAMKYSRLRLLCLSDPSHGVQRVCDFRPISKQAVLACKCVRDVVSMTNKNRQAYDEAVAASQKRRLIRQSGTLQVFESDIEETA